MNGMCFAFALVTFVCGGLIGGCCMALVAIDRPMPNPPPPDESSLM